MPIYMNGIYQLILEFDIEVSNTNGNQLVTLFLDGNLLSSLSQPPFKWSTTIQPGHHVSCTINVTNLDLNTYTQIEIGPIDVYLGLFIFSVEAKTILRFYYILSRI